MLCPSCNYGIKLGRCRDCGWIAIYDLELDEELAYEEENKRIRSSASEV